MKMENMRALKKGDTYSSRPNIDLRTSVVFIGLRLRSSSQQQVTFKFKYYSLPPLYTPTIVSVCADATNTARVWGAGLNCDMSCVKI
jgi:hypothetical protein